MVCGILPRDQNLHPGESLSRRFPKKFNETANDVNRALGLVDMYVPWVKFLEIPGFMSPYGEFISVEICV